MKITEFCIRRPITTGAFFTALLVLGFISTAKMPIDLLPQITYPSINIDVAYEGAGPQEIERLITIPVERVISTVNGVKTITSHSEEGRSRVTAEFDWGLDLVEATNDIRANLDRIKGRLPDGADAPVIRKYDPNTTPVMTIGLSSVRLDQSALRFLAEDELSYQLQRAEGVANVEVMGGRKQEIRVYLKQTHLQALGLTATDLVDLLEKENIMEPAGRLAVGVGDFLVRTKGEFQSLDEIRNLVVKVRDGIPVYLRDVATVEQGYGTNTDIVRVNGESGVLLSVYKRSGMNTVAVADQIYKMVKQINLEYPQVKLTVLNDDSTYIRRAVRSVADAALIGAILAAFILLFFFHNWRATLITSIAMPISIMTTLMLAFFNKMTLNTISLGALALGVGMLVDNAVVVLDNIFRHHQRDGVDTPTASLDGTSEMGPAISASTLTHICVFFPLLYLSGRSGMIFKELAYMVIFSILCSLLVAVTLIPMLCAKFLKVRDMEDIEDNSIQGRLVKLQHGWENSYEKTLQWCLGHKTMIITAAAAIFIATAALFPFIGTEMVQTTDEGLIRVRLTMPTGTRQEETDKLSRGLEEKLVKLVPETYSTEVQLESNRPHRSSIRLRLKSKELRKRSTADIVVALEEELSVSGGKVRVDAPSSMRRFYGSNDDPVQVDVRGYDLELTSETALKILDKIQAIPGLVNADYSREEERPELAVVINRRRAADYGITATQIAAAVKTNLEGEVATVYRKAGQEIEVRVNLQEQDRASWQALGRILVNGSNGRVVPLTSLIDLKQTNSPVRIDHTDQERTVSVSAGLSGIDLSAAMKKVQAAVATVPLPYGVRIYYGGDYLEQQKSAQELTVIFILALLLIYMVMAAQFESFFDPFVIMLAVPFALGGVSIILLLTDTLINSQVYIGLIMLGGVVVNNTIVLVSYIRILIERGNELYTAVLKGARARLRPILMTTATTTLGLSPLAIGLGEGSETQYPLARTVIGGLLFSTVLSLVLIPVIFTALEDRIARFKQRHSRSGRKRAKPALVVMLALLLGLSCWLPGVSQAAEPQLQQLTVTDAVKLALQNYEAAKIIQKKRAIAISDYKQSAGESGLQLAAVAEVPDEVDSDNQNKTGFEVAKTITPLQKKIDRYNRDIALLGADLEEQQLIYQVISAFQQELRAKRDQELAEENYQRSQLIFNEVQTRAKLGLTNISDEIGAEAQQANAESNLKRARRLYQLARMRLRQYLNLSVNQELELIPPTPVEVEYQPEQLLKTAQTNRADLKQSQLEQLQAKTLVRLARLAELLGFELTWALEYDNSTTAEITLTNDTSNSEWQLSGTGYRVEPESTTESYGALLTLKWTIWDGRARHEHTKQAKLLQEELRLELQQRQKDLVYEVQEAYDNYTSQVDRVRTSQIQLRYNQTYLDATQAKLRVGLASVKDLLDAQILWHQAASEFERAKSDLYLARINLLKVTGTLSASQKEF